MQETFSFLSVPTHGRDYLTFLVQYLLQQPEAAEDTMRELEESQGRSRQTAATAVMRAGD